MSLAPVVVLDNILTNIPEDINQAIEAAGVAAQLFLIIQYVDLAKNYYNLYKQQRNYYYDNFQVNGEAPLNSEVFSVPFYVPGYAGATNTSALFYFNSDYNNIRANFTENLLNHNRMFFDTTTIPLPIAVDLAEIKDDWYDYQFRYEEHKRDVYNARRYAQMMDSSSFGVKEGAQVERGLATSFQVFDEASGQLISGINTIGNGFAAYHQYGSDVKTLLNSVEANNTVQKSNFM